MSCRDTQANSAITSFATLSCEGATDHDTQVAFHSLKKEGRNLFADRQPSRADIKAFLEQQEFRARQDADLTPARKESIMGRLSEARQAVDAGEKPDGPTFYAWNNVQAEVIRQTRTRAQAPPTQTLPAAGPSVETRRLQQDLQGAISAADQYRRRAVEAEHLLEQAQDNHARSRRLHDDAEQEIDTLRRVRFHEQEDADKEIARAQRDLAEARREIEGLRREVASIRYGAGAGSR